MLKEKFQEHVSLNEYFDFYCHDLLEQTWATSRNLGILAEMSLKYNIIEKGKIILIPPSLTKKLHFEPSFRKNTYFRPHIFFVDTLIHILSLFLTFFSPSHSLTLYDFYELRIARSDLRGDGFRTVHGGGDEISPL